MAGAFEENLGADEIERAKTASAALGYDFTVTDARAMKIFGKTYAFVTIKIRASPRYTMISACLSASETRKMRSGLKRKIKSSAASCPGKAQYSRRR